jgi:hypothetical protein
MSCTLFAHLAVLITSQSLNERESALKGRHPRQYTGLSSVTLSAQRRSASLPSCQGRPLVLDAGNGQVLGIADTCVVDDVVVKWTGP